MTFKYLHTRIHTHTRARAHTHTTTHTRARARACTWRATILNLKLMYHL